MLARAVYKTWSRSLVRHTPLSSLSPLSSSSLQVRSLATKAPVKPDTKKDGKDKYEKKDKKEVEVKKGKEEAKAPVAEKKNEKSIKEEKKDDKHKKEAVEVKKDKEEKVEDKKKSQDEKVVAKEEKKENKEEKKENKEEKNEKKEEKKVEKKQEKEEKKEEKGPKVVVKVKEETVISEKGKAPVKETITSKATLKVNEKGNPKLKLKEKREVNDEVVEKKKLTVKPVQSKKDKAYHERKVEKKEKRMEMMKEYIHDCNTLPVDDYYIADSSIAIIALNAIKNPSTSPSPFASWLQKLTAAGGKLHILPVTRAKVKDEKLPLPIVEIVNAPQPEKEKVIAMLDRALSYLQGARARVEGSASELLVAGWSMAQLQEKEKKKGKEAKEPVFLTGNMKLSQYVLSQGKAKLGNILEKHQLGPLIAVRTIKDQANWKDFVKP